jgi:hypothetical protein
VACLSDKDGRVARLQSPGACADPAPWNARATVIGGLRRRPSLFISIHLHRLRSPTMSFNLSIGPLVSLIAGILILIMPKLLNVIVALYLIVMGILGLIGMHNLRF